MDFLDSNAWEEFKKHIYYKDILNDAGAAIAGGASVESLIEAVKDYKSGTSEDDLLNIWDNWTKVADNEENKS